MSILGAGFRVAPDRLVGRDGRTGGWSDVAWTRRLGASRVGLPAGPLSGRPDEGVPADRDVNTGRWAGHPTGSSSGWPVGERPGSVAVEINGIQAVRGRVIHPTNR
ncbi:MAG: hypothetical protein QF548_07895 [Acidimicrobiales bacterium]|jgi:hypothetical protein|nr:hypothetical protein [Acidimicrobiales bacterium]